MQTFIPSFHFTSPEKKLTPEWAWEAVNWCWYQTTNRSLLDGKKIEEIEGFAAGRFSMKEFRKMYKSQAKAMDARDAELGVIGNSGTSHDIMDSIGFVPLPLIPTKLNSAIAIVQKIPVEVGVTAQDPLAAKKKEEDLNFLKAKPALEADLQGIADQMKNIGKVDLGTTKHSAIPFSDSPYGLDLNEPDEYQVFVDLLYNLNVEAALETVLQEFWTIKSGNQIKLLEIRDQFKFGVSSNRAFESAMTHLPEVEYLHPSIVYTPWSHMPDYRDVTHIFVTNRLTVLDMFNHFGDEICGMEELEKIVNGKDGGYCACNNITLQEPGNFNTFKVDLIYCEIKSVDYVGIAPLNKKSPFNTIISDPEEAAKCTNKIWGQNTYCFWWLKNTKYFFGIHRLGFAHRTVGQEAQQNFSVNIYRSQERSAVELSIGENKKAQIADIKMQHAIIKSLPAGKYINLKFLRSALNGLIKDGNTTWTQNDLIRLAMEENYFIGDTEGFDGKNDGQLKPFEDIPGGIKSELGGYMQVIIDASAKISQFTGINDQLTGQSANPEGLIGLQKLLINSSINALYYVNEAIEEQEQKIFNNWAAIIREAIASGGKAKQAIINLIGAKKVSLLDSLKDLPLHTMGIKVTISQREEEQQEFREELARLKELGVVDTADIYIINSVSNPKDKMNLLAVKVKQWKRQQAKIRQEDMAQQRAIVQQQGQNQQDVMAAKTDGDIKKVYAGGDVSAKILELASQLGMNGMQLKGLIDQQLQRNRGDDQLNKSIKTIETKQTLDTQKPFDTK